MNEIQHKIIGVNDIKFCNITRFVLIAGPFESLDHAVNMTTRDITFL